MAANLIAQLTEQELTAIQKEFGRSTKTLKFQPQTIKVTWDKKLRTVVEYDANDEITAIWF